MSSAGRRLQLELHFTEGCSSCAWLVVYVDYKLARTQTHLGDGPLGVTEGVMLPVLISLSAVGICDPGL